MSVSVSINQNEHNFRIRCSAYVQNSGDGHARGKQNPGLTVDGQMSLINLRISLIETEQIFGSVGRIDQAIKQGSYRHLSAITCPKLSFGIHHMSFHRLHRNAEASPDRVVGETTGHTGNNLQLPIS